MELRHGPRLSRPDVLQVEGAHQIIVAPDVLAHQMDLHQFKSIINRPRVINAWHQSLALLPRKCGTVWNLLRASSCGTIAVRSRSFGSGGPARRCLQYNQHIRKIQYWKDPADDGHSAYLAPKSSARNQLWIQAPEPALRCKPGGADRDRPATSQSIKFQPFKYSNVTIFNNVLRWSKR